MKILITTRFIGFNFFFFLLRNCLLVREFENTKIKFFPHDKVGSHLIFPLNLQYKNLIGEQNLFQGGKSALQKIYARCNKDFENQLEINA